LHGVEQLGHIAASDAYELAVFPVRVNVLLEDALDLGPAAQPLGLNVPLEVVPGDGFKGVGLGRRRC
jgi:hypothetical protein